MPTVISHAVAAAALTAVFPQTPVTGRLIILGAACAMAPDLDVVGFRFGVRYGDLLGHRGLTHSLGFAACLASVAWLAVGPFVTGVLRRALIWVYLFIATASHAVLDAFTDGGLGVAFFSPIDATRYFFLVRPVQVSPIGARFFSERGLAVLWSEVVWIWLPCVAIFVAGVLIRRIRRAK